jgi:Ca2+-binding EF-hand superfamily protein
VKLHKQSHSIVKSFYGGIYSSLGAAGISLAVAGCSRGPSRIAVATYDPASSAAKAMEIYDTDKDGFVAGDELEKAPGLKAAIKNLDADKDGKVSEQEIADRVLAWKNQAVALMSFTCDVTLDGKMVEGATVTFEPDGFLEGVISEAVDTTNIAGTARPSVPKAKRPTQTTPPGVQPGIYKVRISKITSDQETIPSRYNTETVLGQEVSMTDSAIANKQVRFSMTTKAP